MFGTSPERSWCCNCFLCLSYCPLLIRSHHFWPIKTMPWNSKLLCYSEILYSILCYRPLSPLKFTNLMGKKNKSWSKVIIQLILTNEKHWTIYPKSTFYLIIFSKSHFTRVECICIFEVYNKDPEDTSPFILASYLYSKTASLAFVISFMKKWWPWKEERKSHVNFMNNHHWFYRIVIV